MTEKTKFYMMVGTPCSGKTKWVTDNLLEKNLGIVIGVDPLLEGVAAALNTTYAEVMPGMLSTAEKMVEATVQMLTYQKAPLVVDQTNLTPKARKRLLKVIKNKKDYELIAVYMKTPLGICHDRLQERSKEENLKVLPEGLLDSMYEELIIPSVDEGFNEVIIVEERLN